MSQPSSKPAVQEEWSSRWSFILATTGAAVGLGNVWRFPYMAGMHGGAAFLMIYLLCVIVIGLPTMVAEIIIGRRGRSNPVDSLQKIAIANHHTKHWGLLGWWGALALLLVLSFYSVVSGWGIAYLIQSVRGTFNAMTPNQVTQFWQHFLASPLQLLAWHTLFMILTMSVIVAGVKKGLERATKLMMPGLYLILIILVIYAAIAGNFVKGAKFLFDFHFDAITPGVVIAALGHAFFTLALGAGAMLTYGAYVPKQVNIINSVMIVAALDVLVAILSGLAIFPIIFAYHLSPTSGPGLMFVSLPITFAQIHGGSIVGALFFLLLLFACWTSSINLAEPLIVIVMDRLKLSRLGAALLTGFCAWFIGIGSVLSFNLWKKIKIFHQFTVFDIATNLPTDIILPLGGLGFAVFAGWIMSKQSSRDELQQAKPMTYTVWRFLVRYVAPIGIFIVFISAFIN